MIKLLLLLAAGCLGKIFDLESLTNITIPVGSTIEVELPALISRAEAWELEDLDLLRLKTTILPPRSAPGHFIPSKSVYKISCNRDCKIGETFILTFNYKDLKKDTLLNTKKVSLTVISNSEDL